MKACERDTIAVIRDVLEPWGFSLEIIEGGKHKAVIAKGPKGHRVRFTISSSPKDADAQLNMARQQVRAWLERNGMATGRGRAGERRQRKPPRTRSTLYRVEVAIDPQTDPARDPWAALQQMGVQ
jgi:hypothetical protein